MRRWCWCFEYSVLIDPAIVSHASWSKDTSTGGLLFTAQQLYHCRLLQGELQQYNQVKHISAGTLTVIHPCTKHEEVVDTAVLHRSNMGQPTLCKAPGSRCTNGERGGGEGSTHSFIVDLWLTPMDNIKHTAKEIGWEAKLSHWERVIANSITVSADWNGKGARRRWVWMGMRGLTW